MLCGIYQWNVKLQNQPRTQAGGNNSGLHGFWYQGFLLLRTEDLQMDSGDFE